MKRQHSGCSPKLWLNFFLRSFILDINYRCKINSMLTSIQKIFKISLVALLPMVKTKFYMCLYSVYISSSFSIFFYYYFKKINYRIRKKKQEKKSRYAVYRYAVTPLCTVQIQNRPSPPPGKSRGIWLFWKILVKFPTVLPVYTVKCPTRQSFKVGQIPHPPGMLKQLWKQVLQNFQPLRISCSASLRSTL